MKSEIVIKEGKAKVVLYAESDFEKDLIEQIVDSRIGYENLTTVKTDYSYQIHNNHRIEISLIEKQK